MNEHKNIYIKKRWSLMPYRKARIFLQNNTLDVVNENGNQVFSSDIKLVKIGLGGVSTNTAQGLNRAYLKYFVTTLGTFKWTESKVSKVVSATTTVFYLISITLFFTLAAGVDTSTPSISLRQFQILKSIWPFFIIYFAVLFILIKLRRKYENNNNIMKFLTPTISVAPIESVGNLLFTFFIFLLLSFCTATLVGLIPTVLLTALLGSLARNGISFIDINVIPTLLTIVLFIYVIAVAGRMMQLREDVFNLLNPKNVKRWGLARELTLLNSKIHSTSSRWKTEYSGSSGDNISSEYRTLLLKDIYFFTNSRKVTNKSLKQ
jgi:hypothetical protein